MLQDLRLAIRGLLKNVTFTTVAVVALALGIGATTTIFSFVRPFLVELPVQDPDRLVAIWSQNTARGTDKSVVSLPDFEDWRDDVDSLRGLTAQASKTYNLAGAAEPIRVRAGQVRANYFSVLGASVARGRAFAQGDDLPGSEQVVVLSHGLWQRAFGADPSAVGREILLDGSPAIVVGVMPRAVTEQCCELYVPLTTDSATADRGLRSLFVYGRLAEDSTIEAARQELAAVARRLERDYPETNAGWGVNVVPIREEMLSPTAVLSLAILGATVLLVLAIACVNVANLLLARSASRRPEMALRTALGARPRRLLRQLLTESVLLGLIGGVAGLGLGFVGTRLMLAAFPVSSGIREVVRVDAGVALFTLAVSMITGMVFGLAPALQSLRSDLRSVVSQGAGSGPGRRGWLRSGLIASEVALALVLLVVAGLMIRTLVNMVELDPGFDPQNLLTFRVTLPEAAYPESDQTRAFFDSAVDRALQLEGAVAAGVTSRLPTAGSRNNPTRSLVIEGRPTLSEGETPWAIDLTVGPGFLQALGLPLLTGRHLEAQDVDGARPVAVISRTMAERYFTDLEAVGSRIRLGEDQSSWITIVGIVGDVRNDDIEQPPLPQVYLPFAQNPRHEMSLLIRTAGDPATMSPAVRQAISELDPTLPVYDVLTMKQVLFQDTLGSRIVINVLGIFGLVALLLAAAGIYGVVAYDVSRRTREVGIRVTLGARRKDVLGLIVRQGMTPVTIGVLVGLVISAALTRLIAGVLFQVSPSDPATLGTVALLLGATGLVASFVPALRAEGVEVVAALRDE